MHSVSTEGKRQLDKSCAELVLKIFPKLTHLVRHYFFLESISFLRVKSIEFVLGKLFTLEPLSVRSTTIDSKSS